MSEGTRSLQTYADGRFIEALVPDDADAPVTLRVSTNDPKETLVIDLPRVFFTTTRSDSFINKPPKMSLNAYSGVLKLMANLMSTNEKDPTKIAERTEILEGIGHWVHGEKAKLEMERSDAEEKQPHKIKYPR